MARGAAKSVAVFLFFLQFSKEKFLYSSSWIGENKSIQSKRLDWIDIKVEGYVAKLG